MPTGQAWDEMKLRFPSGKTLGGADAAIYLARRVWWAWPVWALSRLPGAMRVMRRVYRRVAASRSCVLKPVKTVWPAVLCPLAAVVWRPMLPAWGFMWAMTAALVAGAMGLSGWRPMWNTRRAWPAIRNAIVGAALFWGVARWMPVGQGWVGMIGLVLMLHFGIVEWLSPIMRSPLRARSVGEFWGRRWNMTFPQMAQPLIFEPVRRRFGVGLATMVVFTASGLLHELVISLPARGGYGLPTGYFVLQGLAVLTERKWKFESRLFTWLVVAGPAFWLFHPPFVERVMIPFMEAMGAL